MIDTGVIVSFSAGTLAAASMLTAALTSWHSRKSKAEREAAAKQQLREAERLEAEEERISVNAAREAVKMLREDNKEQHAEITRLRKTVDDQNDRIDKQGVLIRRQNVRIELQQGEIGALRRWCAGSKQRMSDAGINGLTEVPPESPTDNDLWPYEAGE